MEQLIKQYVQIHQSLALKGLGQFTLQYQSAERHPIVHKFTVPGNYLCFEANTNIETTERFVYFVAEKKHIDKQEAYRLIEDYINNILNNFDKEQGVHMGKMGTFVRNQIGKLDFQPALDVDLSPDSFGLEPFEWENTLIKKQTENTSKKDKSITQTKQPDNKKSITENKDTTQSQKTEVHHKKSGCGFKILLILIAFLLLLVLLALIGRLCYPQKIEEWTTQIETQYKKHFVHTPMDTLALSMDTNVIETQDEELPNNMFTEWEDTITNGNEEEVQIETNDTIENNLNAPAINAVSEVQKGFFVVLGSFQDEENAENYLKEKQVEYPNAMNLGRGKTSKLILIGIGPYAKEEAQQLITNHKVKGWLLQK